VSLRLEVLGCAGAAPLQGACASYLVSDGSVAVLLDCGPGTLERLWRRDLLERLDAIVVSHMHADHVLDLVLLAGELARSMLAERPVSLHVPRGEGRAALARLDASFARERGRPTRFESAFDVGEYDASDRISIGALSFSFAPTEHPPPCYAARVSDGTTTIVYGADGGPGEGIVALAERADLLVLEATYLDDVAAAAAHGHMTATQAGESAARAQASRLLLTHTIAGVSPAALAERAAASFAGPVDVAHEGYAYGGADGPA
jgi:ribonuclease BN (tRNA processing enzyme)